MHDFTAKRGRFDVGHGPVGDDDEMPCAAHLCHEPALENFLDPGEREIASEFCRRHAIPVRDLAAWLDSPFDANPSRSFERARDG